MRKFLLIFTAITTYIFLKLIFGPEYPYVFDMIGNFAIGWMICDIVADATEN